MDEDEEEAPPCGGAHHGAAPHHEEGQQDNNDGGREEPPGHDVKDEDEPHVEEDADTRTSLTSVVRDPHLQELLLKKPANMRAGAREKAKLAQLKIDSATPLYPGCGSKDTHLKVALDVL
jgi:hypothetical protein